MNSKTLRCCVLIASTGWCAYTARGSGLGIADFQWEIFDNAGGSVAITPSVIVIVGGDTGVAGMTGVSTTATTNLDITFAWDWLLLDEGDFDMGFYFINDDQISFTPNQSQANGVEMFSVSAGDTFGFGVNTVDGAFGPGILTITHIKAIPAPSGAAVFALAGLAAARRRRSTKPVLRSSSKPDVMRSAAT